MTTKAQRKALRLDPNVRERLPTLAHVLDLLHTHEEAQRALADWLARVSAEHDMRQLRDVAGYEALEAWVREARQ
jgi:hypothetical protein